MRFGKKAKLEKDPLYQNWLKEQSRVRSEVSQACDAYNKFHQEGFDGWKARILHELTKPYV